MILINLLPPELRKARRSGVNPVILAAAAGVVICLGAGGLWAWISLDRIKAAEAKQVELDAELAAATARAEEVKRVEGQIAEFEKLHATITGLITRKVFWAKTIDDFCSMLSQTNDHQWSMPGYEVRCTGLSFSPIASSTSARDRNAATGVECAFRAQFRIAGEERDKAGDYLRSFFTSVDTCHFWRDNGFIGQSEENYKGDAPSWNADLERVITDLSFEWRRVKVVPGVQK